MCCDHSYTIKEKNPLSIYPSSTPKKATNTGSPIYHLLTPRLPKTTQHQNTNTACRSLENVPSRHFATTLEAVRTLKKEGYAVYAMETTSKSQCYTHVEWAQNQKVALVLGNEVIGVDTCVLDECAAIVEIPTFGQKNSLNVASAAPVVVFEILRQWGAMEKEVSGGKKEGK